MFALFLSSRERRRRLAIAFLAMAAGASGLGAGETKARGIFSLAVENDVFTNSDGGYSSGVKLLWVSPNLNGVKGERRIPRWLDSLSRKLTVSGAESPHRFVSVVFGQNAYTPEDILRRDLVRNDRPYAGYTYAGLAFHGLAGSSLKTLELEIGWVGPHSFAGSMQKFVHRLFGWTYPAGWANQLKDEPVLGAYYDQRWRIRKIRRAGGPNWDFLAHAGGGLSNLFIGAGAGIELRAGWNVPDDFGVSLLRHGSDGASLYEAQPANLSSSGRASLYFFMVLEGQAVARDLFLDGNTFRDSPRIDKKPLTAEIAAGVAFRHKRLKASFCWVSQTRPFKGRDINPFFGSLNVSFLL